MKTPLGYKIGADPEFQLYRNGDMVRASTFFGHDALTASLGTDGATHTAELRVQAGSYYQITAEISRLIGEAQKRSRGCEAYAGSGVSQPTGGHIHFSGIPADEQFIALLEKFITVPLNSVSDRRARSGYGRRRGDWRQQPHGWEFRSPLSWLSTPTLANGVLAIAWVLARAFKNGDCASITDRDALINYCYKRERVAITLYFEAIRGYKRSGTQLETVEMFQAWGKTSAEQGARYLPSFSDDDFMDVISLATRTHTQRYNPYACLRHIRFFGMALHHTKKLAIYVPAELAWLRDVAHLGAEVLCDSSLCNDPLRLGLSYNLRQNTKKSTWVIKRLTKAINTKIETE